MATELMSTMIPADPASLQQDADPIFLIINRLK